MGAEFLPCILHCERMAMDRKKVCWQVISLTLWKMRSDVPSPHVLHTHTCMHKLNPDRVPDTFGRIILMGEEYPQAGFVMRPEPCAVLTSSPPP